MARYTTLKEFLEANPTETVGSVKETVFADAYGSIADEYDEDDTEILHPALVRMLNGEAPNDITCVRDWTDDHVFCCLLLVEYADVTYTVAFWWMDPTFLLSIGRAIKNSELSTAFVKGMFDEVVWGSYIK